MVFAVVPVGGRFQGDKPEGPEEYLQVLNILGGDGTWCRGQTGGRVRCLGGGEEVPSTGVRVGARRVNELSKGSVERHRMGAEPGECS